MNKIAALQAMGYGCGDGCFCIGELAEKLAPETIQLMARLKEEGDIARAGAVDALVNRQPTRPPAAFRAFLITSEKGARRRPADKDVTTRAAERV